MNKTLVSIVMGSDSDWPVMQKATEQLDAFDIAHESKVISAHRTPDLLTEYAQTAKNRGIICIIAGAGGAAHLPGMLAANTMIPVLGVPIPSGYLNGQDALLSIVQMPKGVPVATFAIGESGAANAALFAISQMAVHDSILADKLSAFRKRQHQMVLAMKLSLQ